MNESPVVYIGRLVNKNNFRVFVYGLNNQSKLVESWGDYQKCIESGKWFSTKEDADSRVEIKDIGVKKRGKK